VTDYLHGAKLYHDNDNKLRIAEIQANFQAGEASLFEVAISDIWELEVAPLVSSKDMQDILQDVYGRNWKEVVNQEFQSVSREEMRNPRKFEGIANSFEKRLKAGAAAYASFLNFFGFKKLDSHHLPNQQDMNQLYHQFYGHRPVADRVQICSEFASRSTAASMVELNKRLTEAIHNHTSQRFSGKRVAEMIDSKGILLDPNSIEYLQGKRFYGEESEITKKAEQDVIAKCKQAGYSDNDITMIIRLGNEEVFDLPYSKKERFETIDPGRMVDILVEHRCAKKKPPLPLLKALVKDYA
jgi:hypothetical protein